MSDHNVNIDNGNLSLLVSLLSTTFLWISGQGVGEIIKAVAGLVSIVAGVMAIRYYIAATKKIKQK